MKKTNHINSNTFFYILVVFVSFLAYRVILPYLSVIALAFITVFIFKPVYDFFFRISKKDFIASGLSVIFIILTFMIPLGIITRLTIDQTERVVTSISEVIEENENPFEDQINNINRNLEERGLGNYTIDNQRITDFIASNIEPAANFIIDRAFDVGAIASDLMPKLIVYISLVASLFSRSDKLFQYIKKISPLDDDIDSLYIRKIISMSKSIVQGSFVIAIVQGVLSGIILQIVGIEFVFFLTLLMIFLSIIPLGAGIINLPIGLWLLTLGGNPVGGLLIILNHFLVITNIDNLLRPRLVSKDAALDPNLTLISVLGGVQAFGFMGVIYGPVIMIFMVTTLDVYMKHYRNK